jgi:c-di-GMP-binding flagellar brake protein YcgR
VTGRSGALTGLERRKHPRVETNNRVSYVCMDDNGNPIKEGVGRTVNISQGGILIETHHTFEWQNILLLGIDIENKLNRIRGRVVYCNSADSGVFHTGIEFLEVNERILSFVINLLKTHL